MFTGFEKLEKIVGLKLRTESHDRNLLQSWRSRRSICKEGWGTYGLARIQVQSLERWSKVLEDRSVPLIMASKAASSPSGVWDKVAKLELLDSWEPQIAEQSVERRVLLKT